MDRLGMSATVKAVIVEFDKALYDAIESQTTLEEPDDDQSRARRLALQEAAFLAARAKRLGLKKL